MSDTKLVVALKLGFHGGAMRPRGSQFRVPVTLKGSWFKDVADAGPTELKPEPEDDAKQPETLRDLSKPGNSFVQHMAKNRK